MDVLAPPEVTSALIHAGPGAASLTEAAAAWRRLAVELENSVAVYTSVLSSLAESWDGTSAAAMAEAVRPFLLWLRATAQQSRQLAVSAEAAASAFSVVHSTVVPPAQVGANRTRLRQLLATNRFGSNTAAIAETEGQYQAMWADNLAALSRYQAASAQATALPRFASPVTTASPTAAAAQAGAVPTAGTGNAASVLSSLLGSGSGGLVNNGWFQLANTWGNQFISSGFPLNLLGVEAQVATAQGVQSVGGEVGQGLAEGEAALGVSEVEFGNALKAVGSAAPAPTAAMGVGVTVGKLTAPPAVVGLLPGAQSPVQLAAAASPLGAGEGGLSALPLMPMMVPPPVSAGSGWRKRKQQKFEDLDYGVELPKRVTPRPPSGG
ncbi:PPE family protein [Mycobacterium helveticum]|uniref:PPE family protein n=1 Tax=Mycobacterium helveticum TaxID=2592811 RepID=A0A557XND9_9MYCO|nr:PPE family protein [Mycobacterium helveticum]TVS84408.1 PPE family protein [Mycobacterium helveticum]TVS87361.1 PPE family protein [Mycobacterium helveticum]